MAVDFSDSANQLIADVLAAHKDRNNLAVEVENGTSTHFDIDYYARHGSADYFAGGSSLGAVNPTASHEKPSVYEIGMVAHGAGCNVGIVISSKKAKFVVIAATPSNKTNYVKLYKTTKSEKTAEDYWDLADEEEKHYSGNGYGRISADNVTVKATISGTSPATAFVELIQD